MKNKKKWGITSLTAEEKKNQYINYRVENEVKFNENEEYVLILAKQATNLYTLNANGYSVFKEENSSMQVQNDSDTRTFKNVLNGKELNYTKTE